MKHIVCFHLFNDYSGSPKVLKMVLQGILDKGYEVDLITSNQRGEFWMNLPDMQI